MKQTEKENSSHDANVKEKERKKNIEETENRHSPQREERKWERHEHKEKQSGGLEGEASDATVNLKL